MKYSVDVPLESEAVMARHDATSSHAYEPSDEATDWLNENAVHWYYSRLGEGLAYWAGMRFFLPTEDLQLMFKLMWGGR